MGGERALARHALLLRGVNVGTKNSLPMAELRAILEVVGREILSWYPDGQARSPLAEAVGRLRIRGTATTRNWNTVGKLVQLLEEG